ncbi:DedA family protein [Acinetobacter higginsii]|uniref:DedA family protein n=1 Tax=Acinetobacter higginsii TaxID=70347 RepID=UPI001F4B8A59|nr:DedA family protein [Acinetobacter higginsii]MCH7295788.1 DedA family protein [Acinetobacter higginsii]MCH7305219.1 DedA family protein [Acinetobacter higginsii]MDO3664745.1 DedA family protein [Acinetobacter higginsii]
MGLEEWVLSIMEKLGYLGIAFLMFLDNIFPPIPSEIIMPSAGYTASKGELTLIGVIIAGSAGSILAAMLFYWIGRKVPQQRLFQFIERYGKYLRIQVADLDKALTWFNKHGHRIVFFGRMIPAVRSLISIPAGISRMPFSKFMLYSSAGTLIWTSFLAYLGYHFSENQTLMLAILQRISYLIFALIALYIIWWAIKKFYRSKSNHNQ